VITQEKLDAIANSKAVEDVLLLIAQTGAKGSARRAPVDTGKLRDSYRAISKPGEARWGTDVEYSVYQELGTFRMRPRPHVRPAIDDCRALGDHHV
jgi:hypothetical protein